MPFPTEQGTQASIHAMLQACVTAGHDARLLTYASGQGNHDGSYVLERASRLPGRETFRSGPSLRKLAHDGLLTLALRRALRPPGPSLVVSHHVEAGGACLVARARPLVFFAHTALAPELPSYFHPWLAPAIARAGQSVDRLLCRGADAVAAISPVLARLLSDETGVPATYVPLPWPVPALRTEDERASARASLDIDPRTEVLLYAGNLDAYQGWEHVLETLVLVSLSRPRAVLMVATASDPRSLLTLALRLGVAERVRVVSLAGELSRRTIHAGADVAVVPRRAAGGLPIKLLDALARGVPTVTTERAIAGLQIGDAAVVVRDDDARAFATSVASLLSAADSARELALRARRYVAEEHSTARFLEAFDEVARRARGQHR